MQEGVILLSGILFFVVKKKRGEKSRKVLSFYYGFKIIIITIIYRPEFILLTDPDGTELRWPANLFADLNNRAAPWVNFAKQFSRSRL